MRRVRISPAPVSPVYRKFPCDRHVNALKLVTNRPVCRQTKTGAKIMAPRPNNFRPADRAAANVLHTFHYLMSPGKSIIQVRTDRYNRTRESRFVTVTI